MKKRALSLDDFRKWGSQGGKKSADSKTKKQRSEAARKAVSARWKKARKNKKGGAA